MVQIYNPNVVGKHILIDFKNMDRNKLKLIEDIKPFMDTVTEELNLNMVGECSKQFEKNKTPYGITMVYLLAIHTFVGEGKVTIDLFTCGLGAEDGKLKEIIKDYFDVSILNIDAYYFTRKN